jgi:hypothetical protein
MKEMVFGIGPQAVKGGLSLAALAFTFSVYAGSSGYVAHEWGTFTSVQGGDGVLVDWRPLESSKLPNFVYDWTKPGLDRMRASQLVFGKGDIVSLQRMETPVIYFYADQSQTVDVAVHFPKGVITEWYPQARQIGPAMVRPSPAVATLNALAREVGAKPTFNLASLLSTAATMESGATWTSVDVLSAKDTREAAGALLTDRSGSHYFAARETDANLLRLPSLSHTNPSPELEKFIFYRGVGNFATPLVVKTAAGDKLTLSNTGIEPLQHLFLLRMDKGAGKFVAVNRLDPGEERTLDLEPGKGSSPVAELSVDLGKEQIGRAHV